MFGKVTKPNLDVNSGNLVPGLQTSSHAAYTAQTPNSRDLGVCFHVCKMRAVNLLCLRELYSLIMKKFLLQTVAEPAWISTFPHNLLK